MKANTKLRAVDPNTEHNRDLAKRLIRNHKRRSSFKGLCTAHDETREVKSPTMNVDSVLNKTTNIQASHIGKK